MIPEALAAFGVGFVSALLPVVNAEVFQAGASLLQPTPVIAACVVTVTVGQTAGKVVIFTASRRGITRWRSSRAERPSRTPARLKKINATLLKWLSHPIGGPAAIAVSATVGLPPLAIVSATAGASTIRCSAFAGACLVGRLLRFAALAGFIAVLTD